MSARTTTRCRASFWTSADAHEYVEEGIVRGVVGASAPVRVVHTEDAVGKGPASSEAAICGVGDARMKICLQLFPW